MKTRNRFNIVAVAMVAAAQWTSQANAAVISSSSFKLAYGFSGASPSWNTTETISINTPTTQGGFTFAPTVSGGLFTGYGPRFENGVLGNGAGDAHKGGNSNTFSLTISGSWDGALPADASNDPGYQLTMVIESISLYGLKIAIGSSDLLMSFEELTAGHTGNSPAVTLKYIAGAGSSTVLASNWTLLSWSPEDWTQSGTSVSRTFEIAEGDRALDGLTIEGYLQLSYHAVPEPSSLGWLLLGVGGMAALRRRKRG